jgi:hypothetical protein
MSATVSGPVRRVSWQLRDERLPAGAALAWGQTAVDLIDRLLVRSDAELSRLSGIVFQRGVLILGDECDLPWVDGILYLGRDDAAPSLLLPTALRPDVPVALLERAVQRATSAPEHRHHQRWAISVTPPLLLAAANARRVGRAELSAAQERLR